MWVIYSVFTVIRESMISYTLQTLTREQDYGLTTTLTLFWEYFPRDSILWPRHNIYLMRSISKCGVRSERVVVCLCERQNALKLSVLKPWDHFTERSLWSSSKMCSSVPLRLVPGTTANFPFALLMSFYFISSYVSQWISVIVMLSPSQSFIHPLSFSYEIKTFNSKQKPFVLLFHLWRICCCQ